MRKSLARNPESGRRTDTHLRNAGRVTNARNVAGGLLALDDHVEVAFKGESRMGVIMLVIGLVIGAAVVAAAGIAVWQAVNWPSDRPPLRSWEHYVQPQM